MSNPAEAIRALFIDHDARHYEIVGTNTRLSSPANEGNERTAADTYEKFLQHYEILAPGATYKVMFWSRHNGQKAANTYSFFKAAAAAELNSIAGVNDNYNPNHPINQLQQQIWQMETDRKIDSLKREYEEKLNKLNSEKSELPLDKISGIFGQINQLLDKVNAPKAAPAASLAGLPQSNNADEFASRIESAITDLIDTIGGNETVEMLEALSTSAKADPAAFKNKIQTAKAFL